MIFMKFYGLEKLLKKEKDTIWKYNMIINKYRFIFFSQYSLYI